MTVTTTLSTSDHLEREEWLNERLRQNARSFLRSAPAAEVARLFDEPDIQKKLQRVRTMSEAARKEEQRGKIFEQTLLPLILGGISLAELLSHMATDSRCKQAWAIGIASRRRDIGDRVDALISAGKLSDSQIDVIKKGLFARCWGRRALARNKLGA